MVLFPAILTFSFARAVCAWKLLFEQQRVLAFLRSISDPATLKSPVSCGEAISLVQKQIHFGVSTILVYFSQLADRHRLYF